MKKDKTLILSCVLLAAMFLGMLGWTGVGDPGSPTPGPTGANDPLPSWNQGAAKQDIITFVKSVTDPASGSYVPPKERIATLDNDGTLWAEKPVPVQAAFLFQRIAELAEDHPEWRTMQPYQAVLEQDSKQLEHLGAEDVEKLIFATHAGMTQNEFEAETKTFLDTAQHPRFDVLYTQVVYQPMLELLEWLRENDFQAFICSGGGAELIRAFSEEIYGIPRENVIGSSLQYEFRETATGPVLIRKSDLVSFNDKQMKPVNIQLHIGRKPILAVGNSDGDIQMLQYADDGKGPFLNLLLHHDDAEREYAYDQGTEKALETAMQRNWTVISMKRDFKIVFPFEGSSQCSD